MPKLPRLSGSEVVKALSGVGFQAVRQRGSHVILIKESPGGRRGVVVPMHREIDVGTLLEIIRQSGLKRDEFVRLL